MDKVTVRKSELLDVLKKNKENHRAIFEEAQKKFRERAIEELDRRLKDARDGRKIDIGIRLPYPEDHSDDYDRIIKMVEMEVQDTIVLPQHEFASYVMDQWQWKGGWAANTLSYTSRQG